MPVNVIQNIPSPAGVHTEMASSSHVHQVYNWQDLVYILLSYLRKPGMKGGWMSVCMIILVCLVYSVYPVPILTFHLSHHIQLFSSVISPTFSPNTWTHCTLINKPALVTSILLRTSSLLTHSTHFTLPLPLLYMCFPGWTRDQCNLPHTRNHTTRPHLHD